MDQQELADAVGTSRSSIGNIENGRQAVTLSMFWRIAEALGKNPGEFLNDILVKAKKDGVKNLSAEDIKDAQVRKLIKETIKSSEGAKSE